MFENTKRTNQLEYPNYYFRWVSEKEINSKTKIEDITHETTINSHMICGVLTERPQKKLSSIATATTVTDNTSYTAETAEMTDISETSTDVDGGTCSHFSVDFQTKSEEKSTNCNNIKCILNNQMFLCQCQKEGINHEKERVLKRLSECLIRGSLTSIDLSQRNLGGSSLDTHLIRMALSNNPNLSVLKLGYNKLGDDGIITLCQALQGHPGLSVLDIGFNGISDVGCQAVADYAVQNNVVLQTLSLSGNSIGEHGIRQLANKLFTSGIRRLHLTANTIGGNGVAALASSISKIESRHQSWLREQSINRSIADHNGRQNFPIRVLNDGRTTTNQNEKDWSGTCDDTDLRSNSLEEIYLGGTAMGSVGCLALSNMLLTNGSLRVLSLSKNNINDEDMRLFSQSISRNKNIPLEVLQLSFNNLTCAGVECLMNALWGSTTLNELRIDNNKVGDRGAQLVAVVLGSVTKLQTIDLGFNCITHIGIKALMKAVATSSSVLRTLILSGNKIDASASRVVSYALAKNTSLTAIFMDNCLFGHEAQRHIAAGIASNCSSGLLSLTGFRLGAVAVTLGLPSVLEQWANDHVLGFFRVMWSRWKKENCITYEGEPQCNHQRNHDGNSSISLPNETTIVNRQLRDSCPPSISSNDVLGASTSSSTPLKIKNGPIDPKIVVAVAKSTFEELIAMNNNGSKTRFSFSTRHQKAQLESPLVNDEEMILETTDTGIVRPPPSNDFDKTAEQRKSHNIEEFVPFSKFAVLPTAEVTLAPTNPITAAGTGEVDAENKKQQLKDWLIRHSMSLDQISRQRFDIEEMHRLRVHFFSPIQNSDVRVNNDITLTSTASIAPSDLKQSRGARNSGRILFRSKLERKPSYSCLSESNPVPSNRIGMHYSNSTETTRRRSVTTMNECSPVAQPASKRAKKARIAFFPRVKVKLEEIRHKNSEREALTLMRQLRYIENHMFTNDEENIEDITQEDDSTIATSETKVLFTTKDAETVLLDRTAFI